MCAKVYYNIIYFRRHYKDYAKDIHEQCDKLIRCYVCNKLLGKSSIQHRLNKGQINFTYSLCHSCCQKEKMIQWNEEHKEENSKRMTALNEKFKKDNSKRLTTYNKTKPKEDFYFSAKQKLISAYKGKQLYFYIATIKNESDILKVGCSSKKVVKGLMRTNKKDYIVYEDILFLQKYDAELSAEIEYQVKLNYNIPFKSFTEIIKKSDYKKVLRLIDELTK